MKKTSPQNLTADWSVISPRAPWEHVSSMELSRVLGVHLQTISNWRIRGVLPEPSHDTQLRGNKNYYRVGAICSWLEGKNEDDLVRAWVKNEVGEDKLTDAQIAWLMASLHKISWQPS